MRGDIDAGAFAAFLDGFHRYHVLVLPAGRLDPADLVGFSRLLGPLEVHAQVEYTHAAHPEIICVGNYQEDGVRKTSFSTGVEQWHADSSYRAVPSMASLVYGVLTPPEGAAAGDAGADRHAARRAFAGDLEPVAAPAQPVACAAFGGAQTGLIRRWHIRWCGRIR